LSVSKADVSIDRGGVDTDNVTTAAAQAVDGSAPLPDILTELERRTGLTRKSIARILIDSDRLDDFKANPARFITIAGDGHRAL
jgi:type III restriction enzyme